MKTINKCYLLLCIVATLLASCKDGDFDPDKKVLLLTGTETSPVVKFTMDDAPATYYVTTSATNKVDEDVIVTYEINYEALATYNEKNKTSYFTTPESSVKLLDTQDTIKAGKASSTGARVQIVSTEDWVDGRTYVIPVSIKKVEGGSLDVMESSKNILLRVSRTISFNSLDISNTNLYSEYWFEKSKPGFTPISLPAYTCEVKVFLTEDKPSRIRRLCNWGGTGGQNMLRFGEEGMDRNQLQWVSPSGSVPSKTLFAPNRWYTITMTFDGSKYVLYVDGVKDNELAGTSEFAFSKFEIGMSWAGYNSSQRTNGRIAEVRLWNKALVSSEIQVGLCGVDPKTEGLVAYWKMNEGSGHIFHDLTGNGYDLNWSDTWRSPTESDVYQNFDKSSYVNWVIDDNNKCNQ
ncbi:MAG: DUF1735 and LamG domain-containing protein [Dysgonomonas sp.]